MLQIMSQQLQTTFWYGILWEVYQRIIKNSFFYDDINNPNIIFTDQIIST
jgi:hypothetical protein